MSLNSHEAETAMNFYVAFGNLHRDPESPTLLQRYHVARNDFVNAILPSRVFRSYQDVADLRHLLGIAIWIRSEQLATPNVVRMIAANDTTHMPPPVEINTHALSVDNCQGDLHHSLEWWKRLTVILDKHHFAGLHSWHVNDFAEKK